MAVRILLIAISMLTLLGQTPPAGSPPRASIFLDDVIFQGLIVRQIQPLYPPAALEANIQGTVLLNVQVGASGAIESIKVMRGPRELGEAAMAAVRQWRFRPYLVRGLPTRVLGQVQVPFRL